jgi:hypothetical protein
MLRQISSVSDVFCSSCVLYRKIPSAVDSTCLPIPVGARSSKLPISPIAVHPKCHSIYAYLRSPPISLRQGMKGATSLMIPKAYSIDPKKLIPSLLHPDVSTHTSSVWCRYWNQMLTAYSARTETIHCRSTVSKLYRRLDEGLEVCACNQHTAVSVILLTVHTLLNLTYQ